MELLFSLRRSPRAALALLVGASIVATGPAGAADEAVTLDVQVRLVDAQRRPIAQQPLRLYVGVDGLAHRRDGVALVTDDAGIAHTRLLHGLARRSKKLPTNFVSSLFSLPQPTVLMPLGLELPAFGQPWGWTLEIDRFADSSVAHPAEFDAWLPDAAGRFAAPLRCEGPVDGARLPDGRRITVLPWRPVDAQWAPAENDATRWNLSLTVVQSASGQ